MKLSASQIQAKKSFDMMRSEAFDDHIEDLIHQTRAKNKSKSKTKQSGIKGISYVTRDKKWHVNYWKSGKAHYVGIVKTIEEAVAILNKYKEKHNV